MQLDLFVEPPALRWWLGETPEAQAQRAAWEARCLQEMAGGAVVYAFPGFMGAHHERLVTQGLAKREALGPMACPDFWPDTPAGRREWRARERDEGPTMQYRYALTDAGRARLG